MPSLLESPRWRGIAILVALAVHLGMLWLYYQPAPKGLAGDERSYLAIARQLRAGETLEPSLWPPLYPRLLALLDVDVSTIWHIQLVQILLLLVAAALSMSLARRLFGDGPGVPLVGFLMVTYPPLVAFAHYLWPEILHLALFLAALWILIARPHDGRWMPVLGAVLGLALLSKSLLLPFIPVLLLALLRRGTDGGGWGRLVIAVAALIVTLAPTAYVNHQRTGSVSLSSSGWFNIWAGLRDTSRRSLIDPQVSNVFREYRAAGPDARTREAAARLGIRELIREKGVIETIRHQLSRQYFRLFDKDSYLTAQLPDARLATIGQGYRGDPGPLASLFRWSSYVSYGAILLAALAGIVLCRPNSVVAHRVLLAFLAYNITLFLILHVKSRYRIQMMPVFFLYIAGLINRFQTDSRTLEATTKGQKVALAIASAILMILAYGAPLLDASRP